MSATTFEINTTELVDRLISHSLYDELRDEESLRIFMRAHVFCVWDFQSLLKALQRLVTCVEVPWLPTADPEARRLVNEIVLDEESDEAPGGGHLSHFELYLQAMQECGADAVSMGVFLEDLRSSVDLREVLARPTLPPRCVGLRRNDDGHRGIGAGASHRGCLRIRTGRYHPGNVSASGQSIRRDGTRTVGDV